MRADTIRAKHFQLVIGLRGWPERVQKSYKEAVLPQADAGLVEGFRVKRSPQVCTPIKILDAPARSLCGKSNIM